MKRSADGWGMIEFLVAIALGLLVTLLASGLLAASGSNYRNHSDNMWLTDGGRYALQVMAQSIRQSAYVNWDQDVAPPELDANAPASVAGLDAATITRSSEGISEPLPAVANGSDVLALRFTGSGAGATGDGSSVNCAGFGVAGETRGWNIFYVGADAGDEPELRCKYRSASGWGGDAVVRGVDSFQVLYGVDTDTPLDGVPNVYLNATALKALDDPAASDFNQKTYWKRVCSIRLALLLHGDGNSRADTVNTRFDLFDAAYSDAHPEDVGVRVVEDRLPPLQRLRARRLLSMTVALRNRDG
ncbi:pilus assembly protein PilW [Pseudoduganella sp. FT26W]|uniref:Pilus assembly protein PilW n=1 Tax=Duganella aquatilis TaxID=2666082 RepID=A0A844DDT9_9BURK|nr:PilW family protein [Duganella aquatilis]MRW87402.1 pilus assembly protein PilW [Duganella aquatilis]